MSRKILFVSLIVLQVLLSACQFDEFSMTPTDAPVEADLPDLSCADPNPEQAPACAKVEAHIMATTLRIEMQGRETVGNHQKQVTRGNMSHATIMGGRYLVTHNHFSYSLATEAAPDEDGYTGITLRKTNGELLLDAAPMTAFTLVYEDPETLVLEFTDVNGNGLFDTLGLPSARFIDWGSVPWKEGMELAQLDWDGENAHVDWVRVEKVWSQVRVPTVEVSNFVMKGASGGGTFWNGYHVGNNWLRNVEENDETGQVERTFTMVALNSANVVGFDSVSLESN